VAAVVQRAKADLWQVADGSLHFHHLNQAQQYSTVSSARIFLSHTQASFSSSQPCHTQVFRTAILPPSIRVQRQWPLDPRLHHLVPLPTRPPTLTSSSGIQHTLVVSATFLTTPSTTVRCKQWRLSSTFACRTNGQITPSRPPPPPLLKPRVQARIPYHGLHEGQRALLSV